VKLFLIKEVWPERNANRAFAVEKPADPHRAAQLLKNRKRERLICHEQIVVFGNRLLPQGMLPSCVCFQ
jgi:hypothetical protein